MIVCENYNLQFSRQLLRLEESLLESEIQFYETLNKGILMENTEMMLLAEEQKKTSKSGFFKQLLNSLKEIWGRFVENFKKLISLDQKWLDENAERLLKTNIKDMKYNMFPYWKGLQYMSALKIPQLNPNDAKLMESLKTKDTFVEYLTANSLSAVKKEIDNGELAESLKGIFRGGEAILMEDKEIAHNLKAMINYCKNAETILSGIIQDQKKIEQAVNTAIKEARRADTEVTQKSESVILEADEQKQTSTDKNKVNGGNADGAKTISDVNKANAALNNAKAGSEEKIKGNVDDVKKNIDDSNKEKKDFKGDLTYSDRTDRYSVYASVCQTILGAKMSIYEERYKAYMKLFMIIVKRNHNADSKGASDKVTFNSELMEKAKEIVNEKQGKVTSKVKTKASAFLAEIGKKLKLIDGTKDAGEKQKLEKEIKSIEEKLQPIVDEFYSKIG